MFQDPHPFSFSKDPLDDPASRELQHRKQERFQAAKEVYNQLSTDHLNDYSHQFKAKRQKIPQTREELHARVAEISQLEKQLQKHKDDFGRAQIEAHNEARQQEKMNDWMKAQESQQEALNQRRYLKSLEIERSNDPRHLREAKTKRLAHARETALLIENQNLSQFIHEKRIQNQQAKAQRSREEDQKLIRRPPLSSYPAASEIPGVGIIPKNQEAIEFQTFLDQQEQNQSTHAKLQNTNFKSRARKAALRAKTEKARENLRKDTEDIFKFEIGVQLEHCRHPEIELPMSAGFSVEDKYQLKHQKIKEFFVAPDPPKPRQAIPQPQPYRLVSSPIQSPNSSGFSEI